MTTGSVLAQLTADVMAEKKTAAAGSRKLTPVAGEVVPTSPAGPLDVRGAEFPYDSPDMIATALRNARREVSFILGGIEALEKLYGMPPQIDEPSAAVESEAVKRAKERNADARAADPAFADRFNKLKADAEAATFKEPSPIAVGLEEDMTADDNGRITTDEPRWLCPTHGKSMTKTSEKTGRSFIGCPDCNLFER